MTTPSALTLVNARNGSLAFKLFWFDNNSHFDHLQRLGYYSIIWITKGSGLLKADLSEYTFYANCLLFFSPYQPFMITETAAVSGVVINFHPDFFCIHKHQHEVACHGVLFNDVYGMPLLPLVQQDTGSYASIIEQMKEEMQKGGLAQYDLLVSYLKIFLINASRLKINKYPILRSPAPQLSPTQQPLMLNRLKDAIEENYKTKHSASEYSTLLNISSKALAKMTKIYFNKTITALIAERIIIEAKRELYLTSKPVKEIAYELGFDDEYYFSRFFKNKVEVSPQLYRDTVGFARGEA